MSEPDAEPEARALNAALAAFRPQLHRYCARMTGTAFDGEDVLQEALLKAAQAIAGGLRPDNLEAWLVRIAHNTAVDFLRRRERVPDAEGTQAAEAVPDPRPAPEDRELAAGALRAFLALPVAQRGCVILMDVLGHSLGEISAMLHMTTPAVKSALHRGRGRLREAHEVLEAPAPPALSPAERALWQSYVDRFNAHDFEAVRTMLAEEVWLDMVARTRMKGPEEIAAVYLTNYGKADDWRLSLGVVNGRPALVVHDPNETTGRIAYVVELTWEDGRVTRIRDWRYARYVTETAEAYVLPQ